MTRASVILSELQNRANFPAVNRRQINRRDIDSARDLTPCLIQAS